MRSRRVAGPFACQQKAEGGGAGGRPHQPHRRPRSWAPALSLRLGQEGLRVGSFPPELPLFSYNNGVVRTPCRDLDNNRSALSAASAFAIATAGANEGTPNKEKYRRMSLASAGAGLRGRGDTLTLGPGPRWLLGTHGLQAVAGAGPPPAAPSSHQPPLLVGPIVKSAAPGNPVTAPPTSIH